ncbi:MAG: ATP-binding protein [Bacteroidetes bacterium]|nr:ATP-binding protein [Bacteroidota bacterium]
MLSKELLRQILTEQRNSILKKQTGIERETLSVIGEKLRLPHIHVVTGIRRCGKSTLLRQVIKKYHHDQDFYYINFEDERFLNFEATGFNDIYETLVSLFGPQKTFFIDEIQHVEDFDAFVRRFYDNGFKFFITGSNAGLLKEEISTRLTGRHIDTGLRPFSFTEYLRFKNMAVEKINVLQTEDRANIISLFEDYLTIGGMPEFLLYKDPDILRQIYDDILYKDIIVRKKVENVHVAKELYLWLMTNFSRKFSYNALSKKLSAGSINTIRKYTDYLEESYLVRLVNKFDYSLNKQLVNDKKVYLVDNGFIPVISTQPGVDKGWLLENLVSSNFKPDQEIFYFSGKRECDFITMANKTIGEATQVCWELNSDNYKRETEGLLEAINFCNLSEGLILTYNQEDTLSIQNKKINIIPVWKWLMKS